MPRKLEVTKAKKNRILGSAKLHAPKSGRPAKRKGTKERQAAKMRRQQIALAQQLPPSDTVAIVATEPLWQCPAWFDEAHRAQWQYAMDNVIKGLLTPPDRELLIIWCRASVLHAKASQQLETEGAVLFSRKNGTTFINPWVTIQEKQAALMLKTGSEMGMTPLSRAHISRLVLLKLEQDELLGLAKRKGAVDADYQTVDGFADSQPSEEPDGPAGQDN